MLFLLVTDSVSTNIVPKLFVVCMCCVFHWYEYSISIWIDNALIEKKFSIFAVSLYPQGFADCVWWCFVWGLVRIGGGLRALS